MSTYEILVDIDGSDYNELIHDLVGFSDRVGFVIRSSQHGEVGKEVVHAAQPWLVSDTRKYEWPGTISTKESFRVLEYRANQNIAEIITGYSRSIFGWLQPDMPEDLFMIRDDCIVLQTVAHEKWGMIDLTQESQSILRLEQAGLLELVK